MTSSPEGQSIGRLVSVSIQRYFGVRPDLQPNQRVSIVLIVSFVVIAIGCIVLRHTVSSPGAGTAFWIGDVIAVVLAVRCTARLYGTMRSSKERK